MPRKRKQPTTWIHRNSRYLITGVSAVGLQILAALSGHIEPQEFVNQNSGHQ